MHALTAGSQLLTPSRSKAFGAELFRTLLERWGNALAVPSYYGAGGIGSFEECFRDDAVIGPAKIIRIIDKLISEIPRRCDLHVTYYLGEDIDPKQLHTQVGLVYPHEHVYDYLTD